MVLGPRDGCGGGSSQLVGGPPGKGWSYRPTTLRLWGEVRARESSERFDVK